MPPSPESAEDIPPQISYLGSAASVIEARILHLMKEAAQAAVPLEDFISELSLLVRDVQRCFKRVVEMGERRDLSFAVALELQRVGQHCVWLYRKIHLEQAFFKKLDLETKLRSMISAEAFKVYEELLDAEEREREYLRRNDAEIKKELLGKEGDLLPGE